MGKTDEEISTILNEIRIESALANELQMTTQIIEKTGLFDKADRLYGKPGAKYQPMQQGEEGGLGGGGGAPMGGMDMGGDFGGDFNSYLEAVYECFKNDFIINRPQFRGIRLGLKKTFKPVSQYDLKGNLQKIITLKKY